MDFAAAIKTGLKKYVDFRGVASRAEYWWFYLFTFLVSLVGGAADLARKDNGIGLVQFIVALGLALPQLTMTVRRNRDAGFSAWWMALWALPFGALVYGIASNPGFINQLQMEVQAYQTQDQAALAIAQILVTVFGPALLVSIVVSIFFFVVSLLPSKQPKQPPVAPMTF